MRKLISRIYGIARNGESNRRVMMYWLPELISATILVSLPPIIDSWIISRLGSTTLYGALGMGTNFLHTLIKLAEAIPVASIAIIGRHNGAEEFEKCGESLGDTFWTTFILGATQFALIYMGATNIYRWLNVPEEMVVFGAPFLQMKSFGVFFIFLTLGLLGFMRAVKNTKVPMILNLIGIGTFIMFDYGLVLGKFGMPQMGLMGSAIATVIQYGTMTLLALIYILINPDYKKYFSYMFFSAFSLHRALHLLDLSWPIIIDKITIASSYVWLSKMIAPMGKYAIVAYDAVKNCERFALLPVMASASVITFLISNNLGAQDHKTARHNIKKIYLLSFLSVVPGLIVLCTNASYFISLFDPKNEFTAFASLVLPVISILSFFDFTQLVLAGALRGAGDVRMVMWARFFACTFFFVPVSWIFSNFTGFNDVIKFTLIYGSFYITTGIIGISFLYRIKTTKWHKKTI